MGSFEEKLLLHRLLNAPQNLLEVTILLSFLALGLGAAPQLPQLIESEEAQVLCRAESGCQEGLGHLSFGLRYHNH